MKRAKNTTCPLGDHESGGASNTSIRVPRRVGRFEVKPSHPERDALRRKVAPQFARVPIEVMRDKRLSERDLRVYFEVAYASRGATVSVGVREIAKRSGLTRSAVGRSIRALCDLGHLRSGAGQSGKRAVYVIQSLVFGDIGYTKSGVPYMVRVPEDDGYRAPVKSAPRGWKKEKAG